MLLKYLDNEKLDSDIFNVDEIRRLQDSFFAGEEIGTTLWFILIYQMWKEKWLD